jgi:pimeloyl-ACP methyl ester carboxylesterase
LIGIVSSQKPAATGREAAACATPAVRRAAVNGVSLPYVDEGEGMALVCVHGAFADHRNWEPQRVMLAQHVRFIALSQRYFGTDAWPDAGEHYSTAVHVDDLVAFLRGLRLGPVCVAARSYGANVALVAALRHPELFRALFVQEPQFPSLVVDPRERAVVAAERAGLEVVRAALRAGDATAATRRFFDWVNGFDGSFDQLPDAAQAAHLANARTVALHFRAPPGPPVDAAAFGRLSVPLTVTRGELTRPYMRLCAEALVRCVPGARQVVIAGARHAASAQNPAAFNRALLDFVAAAPR